MAKSIASSSESAAVNPVLLPPTRKEKRSLCPISALHSIAKDFRLGMRHTP